MARTIRTDKGKIKATAEDSEDDVRVTYKTLKHVTAKAALLKIGKAEYWIPFAQMVDLFTKSKTVVMTRWIAKEKGLD